MSNEDNLSHASFHTAHEGNLRTERIQDMLGRGRRENVEEFHDARDDENMSNASFQTAQGEDLQTQRLHERANRTINENPPFYDPGLVLVEDSSKQIEALQQQ